MDHVKGHQDSDNDYASLPLISQLNVDADKLASTYHREKGDVPIYKQTLSPAAKVQCHLPSGTITSKWKSVLRYHSTAPPLLQHLCEKNQWSDNTAAEIQWSTLNRCMSANLKSQTHFVKLTNDLLPVNERLHRFDPCHSPWCPFCKQMQELTPETRDHLLRCKSPKLQEWRRNFLVALGKRCDKTSTDPALRALLLKGFTAWLSGCDDFELEEFPTEIREVAKSQQRIGWRQWFNGRVSRQWDIAQTAYTNRLPPGHPGKRKTPSQWTVIMVKEVWNRWRELWQLRNEIVHGKDVFMAEEIRRGKLHAELREVYTRRQELEPQVENLLFRSINEHLNLTTTAIHNWLVVHRNLFSSSIRASRERALLGVRSLATYFPQARREQRNQREDRSLNEEDSTEIPSRSTSTNESQNTAETENPCVRIPVRQSRRTSQRWNLTQYFPRAQRHQRENGAVGTSLVPTPTV
jgi:hypothetical protein